MEKNLEDELEKARAENAILLHELDHRVNNNLQLMESLVKLQISAMPDPIAREALRSTQRALRALCVSNGLFIDRLEAGKLDLAPLMRSLTDRLAYSPDQAGGEVDVALSGDGVEIEPELVIPLGLVTGEALARITDRARSRPGGAPIRISWTTGNSGELWIKYRDGGGRMAEEALRCLRESLSLMIAGSLTERFRATLTISSDGAGTTIILGVSTVASG